MNQGRAVDEIKTKLAQLARLLGAIWGLAFFVFLLSGELVSNEYESGRVGDGERFLTALAGGLIGLYWWRRRALWRDLTGRSSVESTRETQHDRKEHLVSVPSDGQSLREWCEQQGPGFKITSVYLPPKPGDETSEGMTFHIDEDGRAEEQGR